MNALTAHEAETHHHQKTRLRLTLRGRVVFGTLGALVLLALLSISAVLSAPQALASAESSDAVFGYVVVQPGESLWGVAQQLDRSADPRDVIAELVRLNQLESSELYAGTMLSVPHKYRDAPGVVLPEDLAAPSV